MLWGIIIWFVLQARKLRLGKANGLLYVHLRSAWQNQDPNCPFSIPSGFHLRLSMTLRGRSEGEEAREGSVLCPGCTQGLDQTGVSVSKPLSCLLSEHIFKSYPPLCVAVCWTLIRWVKQTWIVSRFNEQKSLTEGNYLPIEAPNHIFVNSLDTACRLTLIFSLFC